MIYKFKSKATGDTIMLGPNGDTLLRALGREPSRQGIIEPDAMPAAIERLLQAIDADAAQRAQSESDASAGSDVAGDPVSLKQRLWPMVDMLRRAQAASEPIVWGV